MYTTKTIIKKFIEKHGDKYDYSKVNFIKTTIKVEIICPIHGIFLQEPSTHIKGCGCPKCGIEEMKKNKTYNTDTFIEKAKIMHTNLYDYSLTKYINSKKNVDVICPIHGIFSVNPTNHLMGGGCPKCGNSRKGKYNLKKDLFNFIKTIINEKDLQQNVILFNEFLVDLYIPSMKLAFSLNSLIDDSELKKDKNNKSIKYEMCQKNNIQIIQIFEDEWRNKKEICKSRIKNLLNNVNRIYARKCNIVEVSNKESKIFFNNNHIQGHVNSKVIYGLEYNGEIVSMMSFGGFRKNMGRKQCEGYFELLRFCNKLNTTVIGGASKLFKHFLKKINPIEVISYADRRWSNGKLYKNLGFIFSHNTQNNYTYLINNERQNRYNYRKDILINKYGCSAADTEHNFCFNKKWYRIYDCGSILFKYSNQAINN